MSNTYKAVKRLANAQILTAAYVAADNSIGAGVPLVVYEESYVQLDFTYITGAAEAGTRFQFQLEFNTEDGGANAWTPEMVSSVSSAIDTLTQVTHQFGGGAGATTYQGSYRIPLCSRALRVRVRETGVGAAFGTITIRATITPASTGGGLVQEMTLSAAGAAIDIGDIQEDAASTSVSGTVTATTPALTTVRAANTNRHILDLQNAGANRVHFGAGTVTTSFPYMEPGGTAVFRSQEACVVLAAAGTSAVNFTDYINSV